jgi:hypothetical protein
MLSDPQSLPGGLRIVFVVFESTAPWRAGQPTIAKKSPAPSSGLRISGLGTVTVALWQLGAALL